MPRGAGPFSAPALRTCGDQRLSASVTIKMLTTMRTNDKQLGPRAGLHRQLHADRSRRAGVDSFFDHLHICVKSLERVFSSLDLAGRIGQLDVSLVADLKQ